MSDSAPVTFDLGNSALKALQHRATGPESLRIAWQGEWASTLMNWLESMDPVAAPIAVSSVVDPARLTQFVDACGTLGFAVLVNPEPELLLECRTPETIGRDRLYAARGAWELSPIPAIVLDAGTALTVDALDDLNGAPRFRGGAIAPGPELLAASLSSGAAQLYAPDLDGDVTALGRDTQEALRSGVIVGFQGAARELVTRVAHEAGLSNARLVITGGARACLLHADLFGGRELIVEEHLVHRGLLASTPRPAES
jgi:pantothenate kinase type III